MSDLMDAAKMHYSNAEHSHAIEDLARITVKLMEVAFFLGYIAFDLKSEDRAKALELIGSLAQMKKELL